MGRHFAVLAIGFASLLCMEVVDQNGVPVPGTFTVTGNVEDLCPTLG